MSERTPPILEPDERFVTTLEQQLREGIRRRTLLDPANHPSRGFRWRATNMLATVSLMLLSLMLGATGTFAVIHQDPAPQRELHLQKAAILLERAQMRLEQRRADLAELRSLVEQGLVNDIDAATSRERVAEAETEVRRRELDVKETRLTGRAPVDDLSGPLVAGGDFVAQRLEAQHDAVEVELQRVQAEFRRTELLAEQGAVSERERARARAHLERAEYALGRLQERISLRRSFVAGELAAEEVELRALLRDMEVDHAAAARRLGHARSGLQRIATLHERGAVTEGELREARAEMRDAESDLALAEVQLEMIRQRLEAFEQRH